MPRRWSEEDTNLLVDLVAKDYKFLTGPLNNSKTKSMEDKKWAESTNSINSIGAGPILEVVQVRKNGSILNP